MPKVCRARNLARKVESSAVNAAEKGEHVLQRNLVNAECALLQETGEDSFENQFW